ncbi:MAG: hypothetical protein K0S32_1173 [Bacteroidetes bacterium]|nr:hypothetical protein [Bacteroidota bacterium]
MSAWKTVMNMKIGSFNIVKWFMNGPVEYVTWPIHIIIEFIFKNTCNNRCRKKRNRSVNPGSQIVKQDTKKKKR